jgi:hypothetical protein
VIVELEAEPAPPAGHERRGALRVASALCLAVLSGLLGRDGVEGLAPTQQPDLLAAEVHPAPVTPLVVSVPVSTFRLAVTAAPTTFVRAYGGDEDPRSWRTFVYDSRGTTLLFVVEAPQSWAPLTQPPPIRRSRW